jgi:hypothetical protein
VPFGFFDVLLNPPLDPDRSGNTDLRDRVPLCILVQSAFVASELQYRPIHPMKFARLLQIPLFLVPVIATNAAVPAANEVRAQRFREMSIEAEKNGLASPFVGITTNGVVESGLFPLRATGVSTNAVREAALDYLGSLDADARNRTIFSVDDPEWRKWMNQDFYIRQGVPFRDMNDAQRTAAFGLLRAALSAKGLQLSQDIMHLNQTLGELAQGDFERYSESLYWITVLGEPSKTEPWGWQMDGHHLVINYFVLGDQVVMTPSFFGSEPVTAKSGKYKGTTILQDEQNEGLKMLKALTEAQRAKAILSSSKTSNHNLTEAFKDNVILDYAGIRGAEFTSAQKQQLADLIHLYVANMPDGHARVKMEEVNHHLDETAFAWIGESTDDAVFHYRIHSPVILIEFDHQRPVNLRHLSPNPSLPARDHIHVVVRTPNGNDYGKDLLRQHYHVHAH